jgi:SAM-dependent methyltransferase
MSRVNPSPIRLSPRDKWAGANSGTRYARSRFSSARALARDPRLIERCLAAYAQRPLSRVLDVPCGAGRLRPWLARSAKRYVGADVSEDMLSATADRSDGDAFVRADLASLPFRDDSFDAVVSCRLMHHLHTRDERLAVARELLRVSRSLVIASFWDSASLPGLRRALGLKRSEGPRGRTGVSRAEIAGVFERAGGTVLGYRHSLRFVSQQTFIVVAKLEPRT